MKETFGQGMQDYLTAELADPCGVAVVDIAKLLRKSGSENLLTTWREEDRKSAAGISPKMSTHAALALILLQIRLKKPTLVTEMTQTFLLLSPTQRKVLGMSHDNLHTRAYDRVWSAIQRLIGLVDEFPGARGRIFKNGAFRKLIESRNPDDCAKRRQRMFKLANALVEGSRQLLPQEILDRSDGNVALDATFVPLYGKLGNPTTKNLDADRRSKNSDGGPYSREGSHGGMSHADADYLNKVQPEPGAKKHKGSKADALAWGIETEIVRQTPNFRSEGNEFPLLTVGVSFHIPGAMSGEGLILANSLVERGHCINFFIVDRAYSNGRYADYNVPLRLLGFKHVFTYREEQLGVQAYDPRGFVQISGSWYLDSVSTVLREADKVFFQAENVYKATDARVRKMTHLNPQQREAERNRARTDYVAARDLYRRQSEQRAKSMLKPKGVMDVDWTRRYLVPTDSPDYKQWKTKPKAHQGVTVSMKRPEGKDAHESNAGGLKHEQYFSWGSDDWRCALDMRNGVESVNRNLKRSQYENLANAESRAVAGNTFTYIVVALATVVENLRKIISFYKDHLALKTPTAKVNRLPSIYFQTLEDELDGEEILFLTG